MRIFNALQNANSRNPTSWLLHAYRDLMRRIGERQSWRAFANIVNSVYLVRAVTVTVQKRIRNIRVFKLVEKYKKICILKLFWPGNQFGERF